MKSRVTWLIGSRTIQTQTDKTDMHLLELYRQNVIPTLRHPGPRNVSGHIGAACGGRGLCGKCKVQILLGAVAVTAADRKYLSEEEIAGGYRLACQAVVTEDLTVRIPQEEPRIQMPGNQLFVNGSAGKNEGMHLQSKKLSDAGTSSNAGENSYKIAVDLGSTTLAAALIDSCKTVRKQASAVNTQSIYGADVISRIRASNEGKRKELQFCICTDLQQLFQTLITENRSSENKQDRSSGHNYAGHGLEEDGTVRGENRCITDIAIAGNTTMLHLLRGYSCEKLGQAPFEPDHLDFECLEYEEVFAGGSATPGIGHSKVYLLPGLSAFVGADIAAGLYSSGFLQTPEDELAVFLDLGTNGELAVGNRAGFLSASAAAGPVFEGGSLSCGMPGIPGAISSVTYLYHRIRIQTIAQQKPRGICGTGALEAVAALLQEGLLDKSGLLVPELFETGMILAEKEDGSPIRLTQGDIRNIQMAKAAIRAGIETLLLRYQEKKNLAHRHIAHIYLSGGFGYYLSADTAVAIGLFPPEWKEKVVVCGNTSLKGAAAYFTDPLCAAELENLRGKNGEISLAEDPYFQKAYIQGMQFP